MPTALKTLILALLITFSFLAVSKVSNANSSDICEIGIPASPLRDEINWYEDIQNCPDGATLLVYYFNIGSADRLLVNQWIGKYCNIKHPSDYKEHIYKDEFGKIKHEFSFYCIKENKKLIR